MIDGVVKYEKTVVKTVGGADLHSRVLPVVTLDVKPEGVGDVPGDDRGTDIVGPFGEHLQHRVVHIIVDEDDAILRRADEVRREGVRVENLPVAEYTLHRGQGGADEEGDLLCMFANTDPCSVTVASSLLILWLIAYPRRRYSFNILFAHILNCVPRILLTR